MRRQIELTHKYPGCMAWRAEELVTKAVYVFEPQPFTNESRKNKKKQVFVINACSWKKNIDYFLQKK